MEERISIESLVKRIKESKEQFGVGLHGIHSGSLEEKKAIAQKIAENGLKFQSGWNSILSTAISLSNKANENVPNENLLEDMMSYKYGENEQCNVVVLVPSYISNSAGEKIFLGFPPRNKGTVANQYASTCILDQICSNMGAIPSEFVYGYYDETAPYVVKNPQYYDGLPLEKQDELFEKVKSSMSDFSKMISEAVVSGDKQKLEDIQARMQKLGWKDQIVYNAIEMLNKNNIQIGQENAFEPVSEGEENFKKRLTDCVETIPIRKSLWGKAVDTIKLNASKESLKTEYKKFSIEDVKYISNENTDACTRALQLMKQIPGEFKSDRILEEDLNQRLLEKTRKGRTIITDDYIKEQKSIESEFDMCIASYLMSGESDVFGRFHQLINKMSRAGMNVNVGKSIVRFGGVLADRMEELQNSSERNSKAWGLLLEPILHAYTVANNLDNKKWNPREHTAFEEKLVKLGLIELPREQRVEESINPESKGKTNLRDKKTPSEKVSAKQLVLTEQEILREAICQYINTGMPPIGFKLSEDGELRRETQIEEMRRKTQLQKNMETQRAREMAREEAEQQKQQIRIGINGQPISQQQEQKVKLQQIEQQQRQGKPATRQGTKQNMEI